MYHFFAEPEQFSGETVTITGADAGHMIRVLRMKPGEKILVSSMAGGDWMCETETFAADSVICRILEACDGDRELPARIHLFQGLPKSDKMELIIQKAVELGAFRIVPVATKNAVVKLEEKKAAQKVSRWNAIALAAAKQSKRSAVPEVSRVMGFAEALREAAGFEQKLIPYENAEGISATRREILSAKPGTDIAVFIGPEGGFDSAEVAAAEEAGFVPVTLGKRILRTETAGLCILSALMLQLEQ
ncbi:MAG: 16S rRNA (uracil(1498)-N(3))-methyltransferase [Clostridium sp.]|nr:16S rRNA (uracil(1498)-N(3))-methyltransferase [Clostridium sp.]